MISTTYRKFLLYGSALTGIVIMITMPDAVIGLLFELVHFFFELLFILFEWVESTLDKVVEHVFNTELHETQTIVFYLIVGIALLPLYYLLRMLKRLFYWSRETLPLKWALYKAQAIFYWQDLSLFDKIKWIVTTVVVAYLASFLFM
jgi:hypothetical protein